MTEKLYLEPAELHGVNAGNTTTLAVMHTLNTVLNEVVNSLPVGTKEEADTILAQAARFQEEFGTSIINMESPSVYLPFINHGAFKECYETRIPGWVVKYVSVDNRTGAERQLLQAAKEYGVAELFAPSHYIDLPVYLDSTHIDPDQCGYSDTEEKDWEHDCEDDTVSMNVAILQPLCITVAERPYTILHLCADYYDRFPVMLSCGKPLDVDQLRHLDIDALDWLQAIVEHYGDKMLFRFLRFTRDFRMVDLHEHNIGYYETADGKELPVLLDWLSGDNTY